MGPSLGHPFDTEAFFLSALYVTRVSSSTSENAGDLQVSVQIDRMSRFKTGLQMNAILVCQTENVQLSIAKTANVSLTQRRHGKSASRRRSVTHAQPAMNVSRASAGAESAQMALTPV